MPIKLMWLRLSIVLAAVILAIGCPGPDRAPVQISVPKIQQAQALATAVDARARISGVSGERSNWQWMTDPEQTEIFTFLAVAYDLPGYKNFKFWRIEYRARWITTPLLDMPTGVYLTCDLGQVGMDVCDAWRLVRMNNYNKPFRSWSLGKSFLPGSPEHPYFTFSTADEHINVDAVTSEITIDPY
jgi:hypothetical protein